MTVVGHLEQLRQSACYQKSKDLSCLTCHDPHAAERPRDIVAEYRQKCLNCHTIEACKLAPAQRVKKDATDNCLACHMPRGDTDIPHVAFTHHRIGRHTVAAPGSAPGATELVPIGNVSHLSDIEQKRNLGLAYLLALDARSLSPSQADMLKSRARTLLEPVEQAIPRDGDTLAALAIIYLRDNRHQKAIAYAERALQAADLRPDARADALLVIANGSVLGRKYQPAIDAAQQLTKLRLYSEDWRLLGMCYLEEKQPAKAAAALQRALTIRPTSPDVHRGLAILHQRLGNPQRAQEHADKAQWLTTNGQR
jgi:predicted CXXCH cytochrome family protein